MTGIEEAWNLLEEEQTVRHKWCDTPEEAVEKTKEIIDALDAIEIYSDDSESLSKEEAKKYIERYPKDQESKIHLDFSYKDKDGNTDYATLWVECWGISGGDADSYADIITFVR